MATPPDASVSKDGERRRAGDRATDPAPARLPARRAAPRRRRRRRLGRGRAPPGPVGQPDRRARPRPRSRRSAGPPSAWASCSASTSWPTATGGSSSPAWPSSPSPSGGRCSPYPSTGRPALGWVALDAAHRHRDRADARARGDRRGCWRSSPPTLAAGFSRGSAFAVEQTGAAAVIVTRRVADRRRPAGRPPRDLGAVGVGVPRHRARQRRSSRQGVVRVGPPAVARPRPARAAGRGQRAARSRCTAWPRRCRPRSTSTTCSTPRSPGCAT